jgi:hypothetical protein
MTAYRVAIVRPNAPLIEVTVAAQTPRNAVKKACSRGVPREAWFRVTPPDGNSLEFHDILEDLPSSGGPR